MTYKEQYQKLIEELTELEDKKFELQEIFSMKKWKELEINSQYKNIDYELEQLKSKKENIIYSKKINKLSSLYAVLAVVIPCVAMILSFIFSISYTMEHIKLICYNLFVTIPVGLTSFIISLSIGKKIVKKEFDKIKNSNEYKKVIKDIELKEQEKELLKQKLPQISQEVTMALADYNSQKDLVDNKTKEIEIFKDEVFRSVVEEPMQNKENEKPYTRVKTKSN